MARVTVEPIDGSVRAGPCPMSGFRSSLSRARFLVLSNFGRASGWYIELDGKRVGELVDPQWADMFWDSYTVRAWSDVLRDDTLWNDCRLSFWSQQTGERVTGAFAGGSPPFIRDNRVGMRGLYLTPSSRLESWLVDLYLLRRRLRRRRSRTWCCVSARGRFESRQDSGQFLVAGLNPEYGGFIFVNGFNMAHRADYSDLLKAIRTGTGALDSAGFSNIKLQTFGRVSYCQNCGVNLRRHYGADGGLLRDDEYLAELHAPSFLDAPEGR